MTDATVSLHDRRMAFPEAASAPSGGAGAAFVGLRFTAEFEGGRKQAVSLAACPVAGLAKDAIRVLWAESQPLGTYRSPGTLESAQTVIRTFTKYLIDAGRAEGIARLAAVTIDDICGFETWLREKYGREHYIPYVRMSQLRQFLQLSHKHGFAFDAVLPRLAYVADGPVGTRSKGKRDAYSPHVARQLLEAAWKDVEAAVERITVAGPLLAANGADPDTHGWTERNIAWAAANRGLASVGKNQDVYRRIRDNGGEMGFRDVVAMFHLTSDDVLAFHVLLALGTGLPVESVRDLKADCLRNEARGYADLHYVKRRRHAVTEAKKRIKVDGARSPGAAIKLALALTQATRRFASSDDAQWLLVGYNYKMSALSRLVPADGTVARFCERHAIFDDRGNRLVRFTPACLRKTFKAEQYGKANGQLADAADDHTKRVHATRYADIPALAPLHEATVAEGLTQALESAMAPLLLPEADERRVETDPSGLAADVGEDAVRAVASGDGDVWFATCLGFDKSPYAAPEERRCPVPVWGCLACNNAVITSSKLPAIIAFLNHVLQRRQEMDMRAWEARFGVAHNHITAHILPRFPEREVAMARAVAAAEGDLVWLPAELTMTR